MATKRTTRKKKPGKKRKRKATPSSALYSVGVFVLLAGVIYVGVSVYGLVAPRPSREVESAVLVLNGCGTEDIGLLTARYLRERGLDVVDFRNADSFDYEEAIVVDRAGDMGAAIEVARMLRIPNVIQQIPETPLVDIIIIVGADHSWLAEG
ncbi:MAG: LytR C-terminal domain-containing protein [Candidatus Eisenbacteria sp.]|nr:LytR C-terminal domain-containing protein [Candidatus Eisenbacteria bacterium]